MRHTNGLTIHAIKPRGEINRASVTAAQAVASGDPRLIAQAVLGEDFDSIAYQAIVTHPTPRHIGGGRVGWACADQEQPVDPDVFHPTDAEALAAAQAVCSGCVMRELCLTLGTDRREWGVWGGVLLEDGKPRAVPRAPGRPKKVKAEADLPVEMAS